MHTRLLLFLKGSSLAIGVSVALSLCGHEARLGRLRPRVSATAGVHASACAAAAVGMVGVLVDVDFDLYNH